MNAPTERDSFSSPPRARRRKIWPLDMRGRKCLLGSLGGQLVGFAAMALLTAAVLGAVSLDRLSDSGLLIFGTSAEILALKLLFVLGLVADALSLADTVRRLASRQPAISQAAPRTAVVLIASAASIACAAGFGLASLDADFYADRFIITMSAAFLLAAATNLLALLTRPTAAAKTSEPAPAIQPKDTSFPQ